jgi:hypothetical protein
MQSTSRECLEQFSHILQSDLFERLEEELGSLGPSARLLSAVGLEKQLGPSRAGADTRRKTGTVWRPRLWRKAIYGFQTTRELRERLASDAVLRRLYGWRQAYQLPHESTFSRAFVEFARKELPQRLHEAWFSTPNTIAWSGISRATPRPSKHTSAFQNSAQFGNRRRNAGPSVRARHPAGAAKASADCPATDRTAADVQHWN